MKIHEYQAKEILRKYGVPTPRGIACFSVDEAVEAGRKLGVSLFQGRLIDSMVQERKPASAAG